MVYSKVEMPHHYINSGNDESSRRGGSMHKRVSSLWKLPGEVSSYMFLHALIIMEVSLKKRNMAVFCNRFKFMCEIICLFISFSLLRPQLHVPNIVEEALHKCG